MGFLCISCNISNLCVLWAFMLIYFHLVREWSKQTAALVTHNNKKPSKPNQTKLYRRIIMIRNGASSLRKYLTLNSLQWQKKTQNFHSSFIFGLKTIKPTILLLIVVALKKIKFWKKCIFDLHYVKIYNIICFLKKQ